jgi:hypothetical protein
MKKILSFIVLFMFLFFINLNFFDFKEKISYAASTIYTNSSTGNDSTGDGSSETPYKTFHKAYTEASAGDTINATGTFDWASADETGDASVTGYSIAKNLTIVGGGPDLTIFQAGPTQAYGNGKRIFTIDSGVTASIQGVTIKNGYISWSDRGMGGGIRNDGTLTLLDSEVTDSFAGGCSYCGSGYGGGFYNTGTATVTNSSFYDNSSWYYGGGIASSGTLTITNSSIFDNTTTGDQENSNHGAGMGITAGTTNLTNCTITGNTAAISRSSTTIAGGLYISGASTNVYMKNTIVAENTATSRSDKNNIYVYSGTLNNNGYNIVGKSTGYTSTTGDWSDPEDDGTFVLNTVGTTGSLSLDTQASINDNPQKTKTYALTSSSSIASNNANDTANNGVSIPSTDQRGATRASSTDIGAFEYYGGGLTIAAPSTQALNISFTDIQYQDLTFSWTNGDGTRRVVFMKQANTGTASPVDGTLYAADSIFGSGDQIGSTGWYAVAEGHGTSVTVTGLTQNTDYIVHVVEYNGASSPDCKYNITSSTNNPKSQTSHDPITRYVNSSTGNDSTGDGTSGTPWKTFHHAYTSSKKADTLDATGTFDWTNASETGDAQITGYTIDKNFNIVGHGPDQTIFQAGPTMAYANDMRVFTIDSGMTVSIEDVTIKNGYIQWDTYSSGSVGGGGVRNNGTLTLTDSEITDSSARGCHYCGNGYGGGLYNAGTATVTNSSFYDNEAWFYGGGVASSGTLTMTSSSVFDNITVGDQENANHGAGMGVTAGTTNITNSTITGNTAAISRSSTTIAGGLYIRGSSTNVYMKNTIVAENTATSRSDKNNIYVYEGTLNNNGYNIVGKSTGYTSTTGDWSDPEDDGTFVLNTVGTTGSLSLDSAAAINDNPQKTKTYAITSASSIAVNNANTSANNGVSIPSTDQRGAGRNSTTDIGAFEYDGDYTVNQPTTQASSLSFSSVDFTQFDVSWTNGNGSRTIVFMKAANTGTATPVDDTTYTANATFESGTQIGSTGWYTVYNGTGTSLTLTGLTTGTDYIVQAFSYNGVTSGEEDYLTSTATNNPNTQATAEVTEPTTQAHTLSFSSVNYTQTGLSWTNGDGTKRVVFVKQANTGTATPVDDTAYTANATFGSGTQIGSTGWYAVYNDTGTSVTITGLTPGTDYIAQVFEYDSYSSTYDYLTDSASNNPKTQTTTAVTQPTTQASNLSFSSVGPYQTDLSWTNGDGAERIVFVKRADTGTAVPVDDTVYTANATFSSGTQIGSTGWYVVYAGTGTSVTITGLSLETTYIAQVFEYNDYESYKNYLNSEGTNNPKTQATTALSAPSTQASSVSFSSVSGSQFTASWTNGNGSKRAVFVKAASSGSATPVDDATYTANTAFESGTQIGSTGWYCVYNDTGTSVTVTGLSTSTAYRVQVFEYNGNAGEEVYFTDTATNNPKNQSTASEVQIGSATGSQYYLPWDNYYRYSYSQMIYLDSEIGTDGSITYIKFKYNGNNTYSWDPIVIYMGHTSKTSFASTSDWVAVGDLTQVYSGEVAVTSGDPAWYTITLDDEFEYNGDDNLLVAIDHNHGSYISSSSKWYYTTATNRYLYKRSDSVNYDPASPGSGTRSSYLPDIIMNLDALAATLSYTAGDNGSLTGSTSQTVDIGSDGSAVIAVPDTGYSFVNWSDDSTDNPRTDTSVSADLSVTANFSLNSYTLTYSSGDNGSLTGTASQAVNHGSNGTAVTAVASSGYTFFRWSDGSTQNPRQDTSVSATTTVRAYFIESDYTSTYTAGDNGSIVGATTQYTYNGGSNKPVAAMPDTGYNFVNWSDGGTTNPRTDTNITEDISVTANFAINSYTLSYAADANGSVTGDTSQTVSYGESGTAITAVANSDFNFVKWSDGSTTNPRTDTNANVNVSAVFGIDRVALTYVAGSNGSLTGTTAQLVSSGENGTAITATPSTGYSFSSWSDSSTANPRTDSSVSSSIYVTANFAKNSYTVSYSTGDNGSLTGTTSQTVDHGDDGTAITAVAASGYHFLRWSDNSVDNPRTEQNISADVSVSAVFEANRDNSTIYANSSTGNDSTGDGSSGSPYKTFHKAYSMATPGDTIDLTGTFTWTDAAEQGDRPVAGYVLSKNLTIQGQNASQTIIQAAATDNIANRRVFTVSSGATITIQNLAIRYGRVSGYSNDGGGIRNDGTTTLNHCDIYNNRATGDSGGGISNRNLLTLNNSSVYNNVAYYMGGGIVNSYYVDANGYLTITNSTIAYNQQTIAIAYTEGGGIHFRKGSGTITNSTIAYNTATGVGGVGMDDRDGTLTIKNTIIANNIRRNSSYHVDFGFRQSSYGNVVDNGYNIIGRSRHYTWAGTGDWTDVNRDGTFALYGSTDTGSLALETSMSYNGNSNKTKTLAIGSSSVAINVGNTSDNASVSVPSTDQRTTAREGVTDIGSFEYVSTPDDTTAPTISSVSATPATTTADITWTTNEAASSQVKYDPNQIRSTATSEANSDTGVTSHEVSLSGLVACSKYYYVVSSADASGNVSTSTEDNFMTTGCAGGVTASSVTETTAVPEYGGTINQTDGGMTISLTIPDGFAEDPADFQLKSLERDTVISSLSSPTNYTSIGNRVFDIKALRTPSVTIDEFESDVGVTMSYTDEEISGLDEGTLKIHRNDDDEWFVLDSCTVDAVGNEVTCNTNNFSVLGLFGEVIAYNVTYIAGSNGSITGTSEQEVAVGGDGSAVTAVADSGYEFVSWSDSSTDNPRTDTTVNADISVTASFQASAAESTGGTGLVLSARNKKKSSASSQKGTSAFIDIISHWGKEYIEGLHNKNIVQGYDADYFKPDDSISRAEFIKMVVLAMDYDLLENIRETSFSDIEVDDWHTPYIETAHHYELVNGYDDDTFRPNNKINRGEAVKIIVSAIYDGKMPGFEDIFTDIISTDWFTPYVIFAFKNEIVNGYENKLFKPNEQMTRAEAAKVVSLLK